MNELTNIIEKHFKDKNFDIRKRDPGYSRFMDQKVTPDVLSFIADCIQHLPDKNCFTVKDIWQSDYFVKFTRELFQKPLPSDKSAASEYNKFIGQPLKTLGYAKVLTETQRRANYYSVQNEDLLKNIATSERNAFEFIYRYITKVMDDSEFIEYLIQYQENDNQENFKKLKDRFKRFMYGHTRIANQKEVYRIFPKVLNPFAVKNRLRGSERGHISRDIFAYSDLMYNRVNFRDINKSKNVTRKSASHQKNKISHEVLQKYRTDKAVKLIREKYRESEVRDQWAIVGSADVVHHIFPQSEWPKYAAYTENLIKLTPAQHMSRAHPNSRTHIVDEFYQIQCLLAKCDSIESSHQNGEFLYSLDNFVRMLNECLDLELNLDCSLDDIRIKLNTL